MNALLEILRDPAWEGIAALIAIFVLVLPLVVKTIKFLFSGQNILAFIKNTASITLVVSFVMPLYLYQGTSSDTYAYKLIISIFEASTFNLNNFLVSIIILIAFIWPVLFIFYDSYGHNSKVKAILKDIESILCLGTFYVLLNITMYGKLLFGGYVAFMSIIGYFISSLLEIGNRFIYVARVSLIVIFFSFMPTIHNYIENYNYSISIDSTINQLLSQKKPSAEQSPVYAQNPLDQTISHLLSQKFKPSAEQSSDYVTHLTFMDADTKTMMAQTSVSELINKAVVDGMQLAKNSNPRLKINHPGHKLNDTDANVNKLINIFWDPLLTKGEKIQAIIDRMMTPNNVDVIVTGQYLEKRGDIINVRPFVISKSSKTITSYNHLFDKAQFICTDPQNPSIKILCQGAHEKIRDSVKELLEYL